MDLAAWLIVCFTSFSSLSAGIANGASLCILDGTAIHLECLYRMVHTVELMLHKILRHIPRTPLVMSAVMSMGTIDPVMEAAPGRRAENRPTPAVRIFPSATSTWATCSTARHASRPQPDSTIAIGQWPRGSHEADGQDSRPPRAHAKAVAHGCRKGFLCRLQSARADRRTGFDGHATKEGKDREKTIPRELDTAINRI
ncbi:hypothetical protein LZ30DRAFT_370433 [Colletotrichum cereale]|nr:hypothetical protein LZ30DRAFT_370433 [Colletotrichum cereale]